MSFAGIELSRQKGMPVTLYHFIYDITPLTYFAITDAEQQITDGGIAYEPTPALRDAVVSSGTLDRTALTIRMPRDVEFSEKFRVYPPTQPVTLIIRQGHLSDADPPQFLVVWSGRVLSVGREGDECVVTCEPVSSSLRRPGLRRNYQLGCPHVLYGDECRANRAASTVAATVASISGTSATLNAGWNGAFAADSFREGIMEWTNDDGGTEKRKILSISGNTLSLGGLLRDLDPADAVNVVLGCNHQMSDCQNLFNNILNHGGCPWIPLNNPTGYRNQYY
jgi:uncharacterized phage protein (TIGR02218 family)